MQSKNMDKRAMLTRQQGNRRRLGKRLPDSTSPNKFACSLLRLENPYILHEASNFHQISSMYSEENSEFRGESVKSRYVDIHDSLWRHLTSDSNTN